MINNHWAANYFQQTIQSVIPLQQGVQHQSDLICLQNGSRWVCKLFSVSTWIGTHSRAHLNFTEQLAADVARKTGYTLAALPLEDGDYSGEIDGKIALIKPYCEGTNSPDITHQKAQILGEMLARIHSLGFVHNEAKLFPEIDCDTDVPHLTWLIPLINQCNQTLDYKLHQCIVSHRDLHLGNLVWINSKTPCILDWESAGLIHPFVELIGLAVNCAGVPLNQFNPELFKAALQGYGKYKKNLFESDPVLWQMTMHSWLLWFAYCQTHQSDKEVLAMLATVEWLYRLLPQMQSLYNQLT